MSGQSLARLARIAPLAGLLYAVLTVLGDLVIGKFPDSNSPTSKLAGFYAAHHAQVAAGGMLFAWATIPLAIFGCALWARARTRPALAASVLVGTALAAASDLQGASAYWTLGYIAAKADIDPAALQAWHIAGSEGTLGGGIAILLLAAAAAGIVSHAIPRWLAWPALLLGLLQLTPIGFLASLLFLLWTALSGIAMVVRPLPSENAHRAPVARPGARRSPKARPSVLARRVDSAHRCRSVRSLSSPAGLRVSRTRTSFPARKIETAEAGVAGVAGNLDAAVEELAERFRAALEPPLRATVELDSATLRARFEWLPSVGCRSARSSRGSTTHQNTGTWSLGPAAVELEQVTLRSLAELLEFPGTSG